MVRKKRTRKTITKIEKSVAYECDRCGSWYADIDNAVECCVQITEIKAFVCPDCEEVYSDMQDAIDCCNGD